MQRDVIIVRKLRFRLVRAVCGLCCALCLGVVGCGSSSSSAGPGLDSTADFGIVLDPASANTLLKPGQTTPVTLDLVSFNGFPQPVALKATPVGLTTVFVTPTFPSLPKGITKVVLNVTVPIGASPAPIGFVAYISAAGGGLTRYLNSGAFNNKGGTGALGLPIAGLAVASQKASYFSPFPAAAPFAVSDLTGSLPLVGVSVAGAVIVTAANPYPGITASLGKSVFTPAGSAGTIQENVPIHVHIDAGTGGGSYPFPLTLTAADGTKMTYTVNLYILSMTFAAPVTLTVGPVAGGASEATGSVEADLTLTGLPIPEGSVSFNVTSPQSNIVLTITPTSVPLQSSAVFTQHVTIQAKVRVFSPPAAYRLDLQGFVTNVGVYHAPFTLQVQ